MPRTSRIHIVDPDCTRRAHLVSGLMATGSYAEPYETVAELTCFWPMDGVILLFDAPQAHHTLRHAMEANVAWLPTILYGPPTVSDRIVQAIMAGATGYLELPLELASLQWRVDELLAASEPMAGSARRAMLARARIGRLTPREREVLELVAEGSSSKQIARTLAISPRTVEIHRAHVMSKMQANCVADVIRIALEARQTLHADEGQIRAA